MDEPLCVAGLEIMTNKEDGLLMIRFRVFPCADGDTMDTQMTPPLFLTPGVAEIMLREISTALADLRPTDQPSGMTPSTSRH